MPVIAEAKIMGKSRMNGEAMPSKAKFLSRSGGVRAMPGRGFAEAGATFPTRGAGRGAMPGHGSQGAGVVSPA